MNMNTKNMKWIREPKSYTITDDKIEIITEPHTDLWQRTYYHFRNDNAPVLQISTDEKFFSFIVKTEFESKHRFDQCGVVMYLDSENWLKGSIEYENEEFQHLGSVATNMGYSDWATTVVDASVKSMWYRFSRREDDYCIECSTDGVAYSQMRICHMWNGAGTIQFGVYACSPEDSSFKATFTGMEITECQWKAHDGQAPDRRIMDKLLIVDGSNLLFQMFFGMPSRIANKQGKAIQGTLGFVGALLKIICMTEPTHVVVLFDGAHENFRSELNSAYKANRVDYSQVPEEENPFSQESDIYAALEYLGIKYAETTHCETDDWIAGYALTYGQTIPIIISSFDSDFFQLITDHVSILRYRRDKTLICTPDYIKNRFGIKPDQYADFKSMVGDSADNIKGADKIGPKTAAKLLNEFGTLDGILTNAENIEKSSIKDSMVRNSERLRTNYKVIKLGNSVPLPFRLDELVYSNINVTTKDVLKGIGLF